MIATDPLRHFVLAQDPVYPQVLAELGQARKTSHWMWFIFPQIAGLGFSPMAQRFALASRAEAEAYAAHPVLGPRLTTCTALVTRAEGRTIHEIFGSPDDLKFRSSMTLFAHAVPAEPLFAQALAKYFGGTHDPATLDRL
ncbi:DUF1810 domain-containing protein [Phreatobacter stygius]|uniref:DUF1810 domain-containing protein n=1 Tax=Phreatobacter stygius TaxID=1940610 RepID=A0A4D7BBG5_9HYPH|nr:DUF1810 domain-containing protein [Phreatobacter stygius]QCI68095.1 DUF1810 domain-containing protein [Phreatobacter stygius]